MQDQPWGRGRKTELITLYSFTKLTICGGLTSDYILTTRVTFRLLLITATIFRVTATHEGVVLVRHFWLTLATAAVAATATTAAAPASSHNRAENEDGLEITSGLR